jgi:hypothetical protein
LYLDAGNVFDRFPGAVKQIAAITIRPMSGRLFLLHPVECGSGNCRNQAISLFDPCQSKEGGFERNRDISTVLRYKSGCRKNAAEWV